MTYKIGQRVSIYHSVSTLMVANPDVLQHEDDRLAALRRYRILNTAPEAAFDDLTTLASYICGTPMAAISFIDADRIWIKSKMGLDLDAVPREIGFCAQALDNAKHLVVIPDTTLEPQFVTNPLVTNEPFIRFYAGAPLVTPDGYVIGMLSALDRIPRHLSPHQMDALLVLGRQVIMHLELRANVTHLERTITRQQRVEKALHDSNQRYRNAVIELQHTQAQLIQTEKMSSLGQMVAGVAHEINNPVSFVYGNLTYVNRYIQDLFELLSLYQRHYPQPDLEIQQCSESIDLNFLTEDLPKILSSMKIGADRIRQIVLSLRNFSRLDEAEKKPVDLHQGLDSTLLILQHRLKPTTEHSGIHVIKQYGTIPLVECYAGQMNQVFMNILSNAVDALEQVPVEPISHEEQAIPRQIQISTSVVMSDQLHDFVQIVIQDNGPGIPKDVQDRIFDPFFTTKPVGKGTGLGLSISYQIVVERHSGFLRCLSQPGVGTSFQILLPIHTPSPTVHALMHGAGLMPEERGIILESVSL